MIKITYTCLVMNRFFGTGKKPVATPTLSDAAGKADARVESIEVKLKRLDADLSRYKDQISKMRDSPAKNSIKQRALHVLKQKKMYEQQRDQLMQQSFNLGQANFTIESLQETAKTVKIMKDAGKQMRREYKKLDISSIENAQDEMTDMMQDAAEIQEIMSRAYGLPEDVDEADLEAELEALEAWDPSMNIDTTSEPSYLDDTGILPVSPTATTDNQQSLLEEK